MSQLNYTGDANNLFTVAYVLRSQPKLITDTIVIEEALNYRLKLEQESGQLHLFKALNFVTSMANLPLLLSGHSCNYINKGPLYLL